MTSRFLENCAPLIVLHFERLSSHQFLDLGQNLPRFLTPGRSLWFRRLSHFLRLPTSLRLPQLYCI